MSTTPDWVHELEAADLLHVKQSTLRNMRRERRLDAGTHWVYATGSIGGRDVLEGGSGADAFEIDLSNLSVEDTATITDFNDIGDTIHFWNVDPHLSMDISVDDSAMVTSNLGSGQRSVVAVLTGLEGDEVFEINNNSIELIG